MANVCGKWYEWAVGGSCFFCLMYEAVFKKNNLLCFIYVYVHLREKVMAQLMIFHIFFQQNGI